MHKETPLDSQARPADTSSLEVISNQPGLHKNLEKVVRRHLTGTFLRPFAQHSLDTFKNIEAIVSKHHGPLILDSFCGVGESTAAIAANHPDALVIGVDKSAHRLSKHLENYATAGVDNYHLVRADIDDFWRLAVAAQWRLEKHYILYPNPWPKSSHLKRRCHGSPLFPSILALKGMLEIRSNWPIYTDEFSQALSIAGFSSTVEKFEPLEPVTPFERKFSLAKHQLWRCYCQL